MMTWDRALNTFCELCAESNLEVDWIVVGSVGSVLQGVRMAPNDLDIYVRDSDDVARIAAVLSRFNRKTKSELSYFDPEWLSSDEEPFFTQSFPSGFTWTKAKWKLEGFPIEVVQISNSAGIPDSESGEGIWEGGKYIWEMAISVEFAQFSVPVVPLEIQLESNVRRDRQDRMDAIVDALLTYGYDKELLARALSDTSKEKLKGRYLEW